MAASPFAKFLNNIIALVFTKNFHFFSALLYLLKYGDL